MTSCLRILRNVFVGVFLTWMYGEVGFYLIREKSVNVSAPWGAFLLCMLTCTWLWVCLMSSGPHPYLKRQKETAKAVTLTILFLFGMLAVGITVMQDQASEAKIFLGWLLISSGFLPIPLMLRKLDLV